VYHPADHCPHSTSVFKIAQVWSILNPPSPREKVWGDGRYAPGGFLDNWQIFLYNNIIKKSSMSAHGRIAAHGRACRGSDLLRVFLYSVQGMGLKNS